LRWAFFAGRATLWTKEKMPRQEENYVGLFIDWDNLAISTAVDFSGAVPDVRAIVKAAQRFGTILVARAYAEWNVSSDRLSVYRAGIEPIYAPTFRFESETGGTGSRGKSLADPCLVTDCIDTLHLMPEINVFVLVSGDKDLIPIVRLAQLRGKRVVVIGPDFAAAILRDMADEYIPYRHLAETSENPPTEVSVHGARGQRRATSAPANRNTGGHAPPRSPAPARAPAALAVASAPSTSAEQNGTPVETPAPPPPSPPPEETLDPAPLFAMIAEILREREAAGKPRLRATNLKDQLIARMPGFNERRYGFSRFKDLLAAAEKAGVLTTSQVGPVQWVTGTARAAVASSGSAEPAAGAPAAPEAVALPRETDSQIDPSVVQFILQLRDRSRWLTYTYVLTNLLNHLGSGGSEGSSDADARSTLNRLVQAGILVIDREPREIDVNGTRHRVRLCHVVDDHPLVQRVASEMARPATTAASTAPVAAEQGTGENNAPATNGTAENSQISETVGAIPSPARGLPETASDPSDRTADQPGGEKPSTPEAVAETANPDADGSSSDGETGEPVHASEAAGGAPTAGGPPISLDESYSILREIVREATDASHPTTGPAAIKNRLVRRLGSFDEHVYGFGKFKDYLLAAERAGAIRLEISGNSTRVALPDAPGESETPGSV
jgi:hypothetical protein